MLVGVVWRRSIDARDGEAKADVETLTHKADYARQHGRGQPTLTRDPLTIFPFSVSTGEAQQDNHTEDAPREQREDTN